MLKLALREFMSIKVVGRYADVHIYKIGNVTFYIKSQLKLKFTYHSQQFRFISTWQSSTQKGKLNFSLIICFLHRYGTFFVAIFNE